MSDRSTKANDTLVVALDGDKLGQIGGMAVAIFVMAACFYWRETEPGTAFLRAGWAFTAGYGAIFLISRVILRTTLFEMLEQERIKKPKGLKRTPGSMPVTSEAAAAADLTLDDLGLQPLTPRDDF